MATDSLAMENIFPQQPIPPKSITVKTDKPRPHICLVCTRGFARLEHLRRHERSHTKEKPYECPICERRFARRDLLLRHKQKLHSVFTENSKKEKDGKDKGVRATPEKPKKESSTRGEYKTKSKQSQQKQQQHPTPDQTAPFDINAYPIPNSEQIQHIREYQQFHRAQQLRSQTGLPGSQPQTQPQSPEHQAMPHMIQQQQQQPQQLNSLPPQQPPQQQQPPHTALPHHQQLPQHRSFSHHSNLSQHSNLSHHSNLSQQSLINSDPGHEPQLHSHQSSLSPRQLSPQLMPETMSPSMANELMQQIPPNSQQIPIPSHSSNQMIYSPPRIPIDPATISSGISSRNMSTQSLAQSVPDYNDVNPLTNVDSNELDQWPNADIWPLNPVRRLSLRPSRSNSFSVPTSSSYIKPKDTTLNSPEGSTSEGLTRLGSSERLFGSTKLTNSIVPDSSADSRDASNQMLPLSENFEPVIRNLNMNDFDEFLPRQDASQQTTQSQYPTDDYSGTDPWNTVVGPGMNQEFNPDEFNELNDPLKVNLEDYFLNSQGDDFMSSVFNVDLEVRCDTN